MELKESLEKSMSGAGPDVNRDELLVDMFKSTIAQFFEWYLINKNNGNKLPFDALVDTKSGIISLYQSLTIDNQKSLEWYEELFETTIKEIFDHASGRHSAGSNSISSARELFGNKTPSGLYVP